MKILLDPIHTNDPKMCSANFKHHQFMRYVLEHTDDVFFYYVLPSKGGNGTWTIDPEFLLKDPRVRYVTVSQSRDRMIEFARIPPQLEDLYALKGELWDWDALVTGRSTQVPNFRTMATRSNRWWTKGIVIEDEMPVMSFKTRVGQPYPDAQDLAALTAYWSADMTLMFSFYSKSAILQAARQWFAPSRVRELAEKIREVSPIRVDQVYTKSAEYVARVASGEKQFTVGQTRRLRGHLNKYEGALEVFEKQWIRHGRDKIRFLSTTNSPFGEMFKSDFVEFKRLPREEFWAALENEIDVVVFVSKDEDYSLSILEPLIRGVPVIITDAGYVSSMVGPDYPFRAQTITQAYGFVRLFFDDYAAQYAKFREWSANWLAPTLARRNELWFPPILLDHLRATYKAADERMAKGAYEDDAILAVLLKHLGPDATEMDLAGDLVECGRRGLLEHFGGTVGRPRETIPLMMMPDLHGLRRKLMLMGWRDASTKTGHLRR